MCVSAWAAMQGGFVRSRASARKNWLTAPGFTAPISQGSNEGFAIRPWWCCRRSQTPWASSSSDRIDFDYVVIGAGMAGVLSGIRLRQAGYEDWTIYEKGDTVGGTWRENTYPGLSCDVPSHIYSYAFEPNPDWSQRFAPGAEVWIGLPDPGNEGPARALTIRETLVHAGATVVEAEA